MLRNFSVSGYKNFNQAATLDLTKVRDYGFNTNCITDNLLGKVLIMGPNGSGKSNLGYALFDIVYTLTDKQPCREQQSAQSFINGDANHKHATFIYEFQQGESVITYEYRKNLPMSLLYEKMSVDGNILIEFDHAKNKLISNNSSKTKVDGLRWEGRDGSLSIVRYIANNTPQEKESPIMFVMDFVNRMLYFKSTQDGNMFIGFERAGDTIESYIVRNGLIKEFEGFLKEHSELDLNIESAKVAGMPGLLVQKLNSKSLIFQEVASSGTKALELFFYWSKRFNDVSLLFIDEFDAFYHFELSEKIMKFVAKYTNTQIILTSHNTNLVSNKVMRPDCYLQIRGGTITSFSESTDRELREGHNLEKMLRNGEFE
ncbi:MAG: AAA family ATPase [Candidatus Methanoplasma sp.]|jgi:AAA15 family ATPase/GTPase|nr:AAA family ATPase [Candidatus Methanoplasma sp.]